MSKTVEKVIGVTEHDGHMRWALWIGEHQEWGWIEIIVPLGIRAETAGIILADSSDLMRQVAQAHGLENATVSWSSKSYDAQGMEIRGDGG